MRPLFPSLYFLFGRTVLLLRMLTFSSELSEFGILRKVHKLGPWSTYLRLLNDWKERPGFGPRKIADKVIRFFRFYSLNRHKAVILTPSPHLSSYNPDDNRHDLRPFLYVVDWPWQFGKIRRHLDELEVKIEEKEKNASRDKDVD